MDDITPDLIAQMATRLYNELPQADGASPTKTEPSTDAATTGEVPVEAAPPCVARRECPVSMSSWPHVPTLAHAADDADRLGPGQHGDFGRPEPGPRSVQPARRVGRRSVRKLRAASKSANGLSAFVARVRAAAPRSGDGTGRFRQIVPRSDCAGSHFARQRFTPVRRGRDSPGFSDSARSRCMASRWPGSTTPRRRRSRKA